MIPPWFTAAMPGCSQCFRVVLRLEESWHWSDGAWRKTVTFVCADGHRTVVKPL